MAEVEARKVEAVLRRLVKEFGMAGKDEDLLWDAIEDVIRAEDDKALTSLATAFSYEGLTKTKVWQYYAEA